MSDLAKQFDRALDDKVSNVVDLQEKITSLAMETFQEIKSSEWGKDLVLQAGELAVFTVLTKTIDESARQSFVRIAQNKGLKSNNVSITVEALVQFLSNDNIRAVLKDGALSGLQRFKLERDGKQRLEAEQRAGIVRHGLIGKHGVLADTSL